MNLLPTIDGERIARAAKRCRMQQTPHTSYTMSTSRAVASTCGLSSRDFVTNGIRGRVGYGRAKKRRYSKLASYSVVIGLLK
jgi:hypothetical protein